METKKKKKGKNKKHEKAPKMTKSQYLAKIAEQNAILAEARKKFKIVEDEYLGSENRHDQLREDVADIIKYLEHEIEENEEEIKEFGIKIAEYKEEIKKNDAYYQSIFAKMENEYEEKNLALKHQLELVNAKLFASDEVRQQREDYLKKKAEIQKRLEEMRARHQKEIYEAEKQEIIRQDRMQKERDIRVTNLATDFRQATDIAIGETTNKLIRDNITLSNNLSCMQQIVQDAKETFKKSRLIEKNYRFNAELIDEQHEQILRKYSLRLTRIDNLLRCLEELHERLDVSQTLVKENRRLGRTIAERDCILKEKAEELSDVLKLLEQTEEANVLTKNNFNSLRNEYGRIQFILYEAAKKAKEAIDVEQISYTEEDTELTGEELEENTKEFHFGLRESAIETIVAKLSEGLVTESDYPQAVLSSESQMTSFDSATSDLNRRSSEISRRRANM